MPHLFITPDKRLVDGRGKPVDKRASTGMADVYVWVPSEHITLLEANIPTRNAGELEQSLPFAVEDELLEDVEQLHIAWNMTPRNVPLRVAVVRKALMREWIELIRPLRLVGYQMVPDVFSLPWQASDTSASMWVGKQRSILRTGQNAGFAGSAEAVEAFLRINALTPVRYYQRENATEVAAEAEKKKPAKGKKPAPKNTPGETKADKAADIPKAEPHYPGLPVYEPKKEDEYINLLQGDFVGGAAFSRVLKRSLVPLAGLAIIFLLVLSHQVVQYLILRKDVHHFSDLVVMRAQEILPGYRVDQPLQELIARQLENRRVELEARAQTGWSVFEQAIPLLRNCNNCVYDLVSIDQSSNIQIKVSSFTPLTGLESQFRSLEGYSVDTSISSRREGNNDYHTLSLTLGLIKP